MSKTLFLDQFLINTKTKKKCNFSTKITDYPLCKYASSAVFKAIFLSSEKTCFLTRTSPNSFSRCSLHKRICKQTFKIFDQNHALTPLEKFEFCGFLKAMFSWSRKAFFIYKSSKIFFSGLIFTIYYMGIQGVKRGEKGLHEVTRSDRGLQGVGGVYKG